MCAPHSSKKLPKSTTNCLQLIEASALAEVEKVLGTKFRKRALLAQALVHRSCQSTVNGIVLIQSNEKLEHLGDSVLRLAVCDYLHKKFSDKNEHFYTQVMWTAVSNQVLSEAGKSCGLERFLIKDKTGTLISATAVADVMEALVAALYLDRGLTAVNRFLSRHFYPTVDAIAATK